MRGKKTSTESIVAVMCAHAMNPENTSEVSRLSGIPESTCRNIIAKYKNDERFAKLREDSARAMAEKVSDLAELAYQNLYRELAGVFMAEGKEKKEISLSDLTRTFGILLDKKSALEREERGEDSDIINVTFNDYG